MAAEFTFIWGVCLHPSLLGMDGAVLACFGQHLKDYSLYQAIYASLYS